MTNIKNYQMPNQPQLNQMKHLLVLIGLLLGVTLTAGLAQNRETKIKPTDVISLRISGVPADDAVDISQTYSVANDGKFPLPHVGRITAAGLTPSQLGIRVEQAYTTAQIFTKPTVVVSTQELQVNSEERALKYISINGEVKAPQRARFSDGMTLLDALAQAGGFTDWANREKVRVIRSGKTTEHDVRKIGQDPTRDIALRENDKIIVIHR
jgi:protein involved in polysaccharide export with SLBB domain